ncbi:MAG: hypothetical protein N4A71_07985 [Carboxylicivirga sp.]|jgi:hypothetical protein|nr:hypothetical protein [Carboxylicivirga sp.]
MKNETLDYKLFKITEKINPNKNYYILFVDGYNSNLIIEADDIDEAEDAAISHIPILDGDFVNEPILISKNK